MCISQVEIVKRKALIDKSYKEVSIRRQSQLLCLNRSSLYYKHQGQMHDNDLSNLIVEIYSNYPIYGYRRINAILRREGVIVNSKKVRRLMKLMNLEAIYPKMNTSKRRLQEAVYPYLLSNLEITRPNHVWQVDITYLRILSGFMYLVAVIDVYSRFVVGYRLSNSLETESCLLALEDAIAKYGKPAIINSDQGSQFTSEDWINSLKQQDISISMTGKGRCNDNANIERLWRSLKYEGSYLYRWNSVLELKTNTKKWLNWYNEQRPHQALNYKVPAEVYGQMHSGFMDKFSNLSTIPLCQPQLQNYKNFIFCS